jgi:hypothetical protein
MPDTRNELARVQADIKTKIREAESLTIAKGDDDSYSGHLRCWPN